MPLKNGTNLIKIMKRAFLLLFILVSFSAFGQKQEWIPFSWTGDSVSGKYFDKLAMIIPVTIDNLPYKFKMQLDLGAVTTVLYGNTILPYLNVNSELKNKLDTTLIFWIQGQKNYKFKNVNIKLGSVSLGNKNIGYFQHYGKILSNDSINTNSEKLIGTIASDLFQDKILIIDYPNKRISVTTDLPKQLDKVNFQPCKIKDGRIKIPLKINNEQEYLLFDTGSSLFALMTTEKRAKQISGGKVIDSLRISSWGKHYIVDGREVISEIKFAHRQLHSSKVFYDKLNKYGDLYKKEEIWGITGNSYFLNNIIIIDYKNKRFGIE